MTASSIGFGWTVPELDAAPVVAAAPAQVSRKRRWDDDHHRMLQLMLGQLQQYSPETLDLLGTSASCPQLSASLELELDAPLPPGWEKCLDLKTGSIYYTNRSTGTNTCWHPRKPIVADLNSPPSPCSSGLTNEASAIKTSDEPSLKLRKRGHVSALGKPEIGDSQPEHSSNVLVDLNSLPEDQLSETATVTPATEYSNTLSSDRVWIQKTGTSTVCMSAASSSSSSSPSTISVHELDGCPAGEQKDQGRLGCKVSEVESIVSEASSMMTVGCAKCLMFVMLSRSDPKCPKCGTCAPLDFLQPVAKKYKF